MYNTTNLGQAAANVSDTVLMHVAHQSHRVEGNEKGQGAVNLKEQVGRYSASVYSHNA